MLRGTFEWKEGGLGLSALYVFHLVILTLLLYLQHHLIGALFTFHFLNQNIFYYLDSVSSAIMLVLKMRIYFNISWQGKSLGTTRILGLLLHSFSCKKLEVNAEPASGWPSMRMHKTPTCLKHPPASRITVCATSHSHPHLVAHSSPEDPHVPFPRSSQAATLPTLSFLSQLQVLF